jgi:hypothetical protein
LESIGPASNFYKVLDPVWDCVKELKKVVLVRKKLFHAKMGLFGKKLKKYFFAPKNPNTAFWGKLKNYFFFSSKKFFHAFTIDKNSISQRNPKQALS